VWLFKPHRFTVADIAGLNELFLAVLVHSCKSPDALLTV